MRIDLLGGALLVLLVLGASSTPETLRAGIDEFLIELTFIDGLPVPGEDTRIAITVVDPETRAIPDDPAIVYFSGGPLSYRLTLDRVPTTFVTLPPLVVGDYDIRVQIPDRGATEPLRLTVAEPPLFEANPLLGGILMSLGGLVLVFILLSSRFDTKNKKA